MSKNYAQARVQSEVFFRSLIERPVLLLNKVGQALVAQSVPNEKKDRKDNDNE